MYLYRLITHTTQFNAFFLIWDPPSIFLASFLIWPTKSTLPLCSLYSYCALYTIWYFYKLQIHSHIHTRIRIRIHMKSYIWRACWQLPFPLGLSQSSYTCVFNLFALIIHNSINANKLTLSKMLYRFSLFLLFLPLSLSLGFSFAEQPCNHMSILCYPSRCRLREGYRDGEWIWRWNGMGRPTNYIAGELTWATFMSIQYISFTLGNDNLNEGGELGGHTMLSSIDIRHTHTHTHMFTNVVTRSFCANFRKINL